MKTSSVMNFTRLIILVTLFLSSPLTIFATDLNTFATDLNPDGKKEESKKINIDSRTGYKKANLNWNIAPDNNPNVLPELEYNNLEIYEAGVDVKAVIHQIYSRASISFGKIVDGEGKDSDYLQDDLNSQVSKSESEVYDDVRALCIGLGYQFDVNKNNLKISPLAGLSYQAQNLRQKEGIQTVPAAGLPSQGRGLAGLNNTYEVEWRSWFLGVDFVYELFKDLYLSSTLEYHRALYEADWKLRPDFAQPVNFIHEAVGTGSVINVSVNRVFAQRWLVGLLYDWQHWSTMSGDDMLFGPNGGSAESKQDELNYGSQSINVSIGFNF